MVLEDLNDISNDIPELKSPKKSNADFDPLNLIIKSYERKESFSKKISSAP